MEVSERRLAGLTENYFVYRIENRMVTAEAKRHLGHYGYNPRKR